MKRLFLVTFFIFAATIVFAQNSDAVIKEFTGTVELKRSNSSAWEPAKPGDAVSKSMIISTGFRSMAVLTVGSSSITVHPLTRLSLEEIINQNKNETLNVKLNTGKVKVEVTPPSGTKASVNVQSPSSTASVRGTSFEMDSDSLQVHTGAVAYSGTGGRTVTVKAGKKSFVSADGNVVSSLEALEGMFPDMFGNRSLRARISSSDGEGPGSITIGVGGFDDNRGDR